MYIMLCNQCFVLNALKVHDFECFMYFIKIYFFFNVIYFIIFIFIIRKKKL